MQRRAHERGASRLSALGQPRFRRYWLGSLAAVGGAQLMIVGQGWLVFELTGSSLDLGLLGVAVSVPTIVASFFGGVLADRFDQRKTIIVTSLINAALLSALAALDATGAVRVWHVLAIAAMVALPSGIEWPTRQAIFPRFIEREHMMSAVALNSVLWQSTRMVLPALAGVIIAISDTSVVFVASAAGFFVMALVLANMRVDRGPRASAASLQQLAEGVRFIVGHRLFSVLIALSWVHMFFGVSAVQLMPVFADRLGSDETGFGALVSASGVGSVTGTIVVGAWQRSPRLGRIMLGAVVATALCIAAFALVVLNAGAISAAYPVAIGWMVASGLFSSIFLITSMTVLQLHVPDPLRGRVMGIHGITFSLIPLGGLFSGTLALWTGAPVAVLVACTIVVLVAGAIMWRQAEIRELDGTTIESAGAGESAEAGAGGGGGGDRSP